MPLFGYGTSRTARRALFAFAGGVKQTIAIGIVAIAGRCRQRCIRDHRSDPDVTAVLADEPLMQTEGSQPGGKGHVAFGPDQVDLNFKKMGSSP